MNFINNNRVVLLPMLALISFVFLFLSGCGSTQPTNFYQFDETVNADLVGVETGAIIGIGPIQLPEYLNRPQIVTRNSAYHLSLSEFNRWAEPLNESITRMLVMNLSNNLHSNRVYWVPRQDRHIPLDVRVAVDFGHFDGKLGESVSLESRWSVYDKDHRLLLTKVSLIKEKVNGTNYEDLVMAMSQALKALGAEISMAVKPFLSKPELVPPPGSK